MSSMRPIIASGGRMVSVPPVASSRSAPGDHGEPGGVHEPEPGQVQHDLSVAADEHRFYEGAELGGGQDVHLTRGGPGSACPSAKLAATEKSGRSGPGGDPDLPGAIGEDLVGRPGSARAPGRPGSSRPVPLDRGGICLGRTVDDARWPTARRSTQGRLLQGCGGSRGRPSQPSLSKVD